MPFSAILFLVGFLVGCVLAFTRHPVYGLITYIATLYLDPHGQWWGYILPNLRWELIPAAITLVMMLVTRKEALALALSSAPFRGFIVFVAWIVIQLPWAINPPAQEQLLTIWCKFLLVSIMILGCVDSWNNLKLVLWAHVLGCVYMGWIAHEFYHGGRFEGFGLGSIEDANTGALQLVTGFLAAASLFMASGRTAKLVLLFGMALIANGIISTESREGFLEIACAGLAFIAYAPKAYRARIIGASILAGICFLYLSSGAYWQRIQTIEAAGAKVQGVDTGHSRIVILKSQWRMFQSHPLGCGHGCTEALSPQFIPKRYLSPLVGQRASHNTVMTMLVDHGIPGVLLYVAFVAWTFRFIRRIAGRAQHKAGIAATFLPGVTGVMVAIVIGDMFSQFPLLEVRIWFLSLLVTYARLLETRGDAIEAHTDSNPKDTLSSLPSDNLHAQQTIRWCAQP